MVKFIIKKPKVNTKKFYLTKKYGGEKMGFKQGF